MSLFNRNFWKGMITGGITSLLIVQFLQEAISKEQEDSFASLKKSLRQGNDSTVEISDEEMGGLDILEKIKETGEELQSEKQNSQTANDKQNNEEKNEAEIEEKISLIQEKMDSLSNIDESD